MNRSCFRKTRLLCPASRYGILLLLAAGWGWSQVSNLSVLDPPRHLPSGVRLTRTSVHVGGFSLGGRTAGGPASNLGMGWLTAGGASADVGWYAPGRQYEAFVEYQTAYNAVWKHPTLNGWDHALSFAVQRKFERRLAFTVAGAGESAETSNFLFPSWRNLSLVQTFSPVNQTPAGDINLSPDNFPISVLLLGARRKSASLVSSLTFPQPPRITWHWGAHAIRHLTGASRDPRLAGAFLYPSTTEGMVNSGLSYSLSRRTRIGGGVDYRQAFSRFDRLQVGSGTGSINHVIGRQSFLHVEGGFGWLAGLGNSSGRPAMSTYRAGLAVGTKTKEDMFVLAVRREIGDRLGLGAANTAGAIVAWSRHWPSGVWRLEANLAYERMAGRNIQLFHGWVQQTTLARRVTRQTSLVTEFVYMRDAGRRASDFTHLAWRGPRLSLVWTPGVVW